MLTKAHAIAEFDFRTGRILPDYLGSKRDACYLGIAEEMLRIYRQGIGCRRGDLHRQVNELFYGIDCHPKRIASFAKLLDDVSEYDSSNARKAAKVRTEVFLAASKYHPLVARADELFENQETAVKHAIAERFSKPWNDIEEAMFADVLEYRRLRSFSGYTNAATLLRRYNVAQLQAALYDAVEMRIWAKADYKVILRYAKLAGLMHDIERSKGGYRFRLTGPASVLRESRRYGVQMAKFLPSLLACSDWQMEADIQKFRKGPPLRLCLTSHSGFKSEHPAPNEFDSSVEETFARKWGSETREGWLLQRESDVLFTGQKVFTPDFTFVREDGTRVFLEIVGFWTPQYLEQKAETLSRFSGTDIIVAAHEKAATPLLESAARCIVYKSCLKVDDVITALREYV